VQRADGSARWVQARASLQDQKREAERPAIRLPAAVQLATGIGVGETLGRSSEVVDATRMTPELPPPPPPPPPGPSLPPSAPPGDGSGKPAPPAPLDLSKLMVPPAPPMPPEAGPVLSVPSPPGSP